MMYGITEAFRSTFLHPDDFERKMPSIGKPFPGVEISIANDKGNQCDPGEIGEIVHKGSFVSPGYWNDPERTRRIFKNGSLYTGDLGKIDPEGYIYFVGRKDNMIKYMGYRISPEEIEECVYKINGIKEAAVITIRDEESDLKIKLVISCEDGFQISSTDVINHCKSYLPYYMVPHILEFVAEMPKTGTFKINRSQLK
jgi:acyl-CoA synthetase (AMP-forming)/AMP-acid ligase II